MTIDQYLAGAHQACDLARAILRDAGTAVGRIHRKGCLDFWTDIDVEVETSVIDLLANRWPAHGIVGEELAPLASQGPFTWYIDPLDGTNNFIAGRPDVAFIALYREDAPIVAAIDLPYRGLRVVATTETAPRVVTNDGDRAARLVPMTDPLHLVGLPGDLRTDPERARVAAAVERLSRDFGLRVSGALAYDLATMLTGEVSARVSFAPKPVDIAAAALLVPRAGGVITDIDGGAFAVTSGSVLAAATPSLHRLLLAALSSRGEVHGD